VKLEVKGLEGRGWGKGPRDDGKRIVTEGGSCDEWMGTAWDWKGEWDGCRSGRMHGKCE